MIGSFKDFIVKSTVLRNAQKALQRNEHRENIPAVDVWSNAKPIMERCPIVTVPAASEPEQPIVVSAHVTDVAHILHKTYHHLRCEKERLPQILLYETA